MKYAEVLTPISKNASEMMFMIEGEEIKSIHPIASNIPNYFFTKNTSIKTLAKLHFESIDSKSLLTDRLKLENFTAESILISSTNGDMILDKSINEQLQVASITKLLSILTALKYEDNLDLYFTIPEETDEVTGNVLGFQKGEKYKFADLIAASLIFSSNDAIRAIETNIEGLYRISFVEEMNKLASDLNMTSSSFGDSIGFDLPNSYSTAEDIMKLSKFAYQNDIIRRYSTVKEFRIYSEGGKVISFRNTNEMLKYENVYGLKTGTTEQAKECLVMILRHYDTDYYVVILGSGDRYQDATKIYQIMESLK